VEALGTPKVNDLGVSRMECKVESGKVGWVTTKGNQGTVYLETFSAYKSFLSNLERNLDSTAKCVTKVVSFLKKKGSDLSDCSQGALHDAKHEISKLKPNAVTGAKKMDELRRKVAEAKREFTKKQEAERRLQREARDRKAAKAVLAVVAEKVKLMEEESLKLEEAVRELGDSDSLDFINPRAVREEAAKLAVVASAAVAEVKTCLSQHQPALAKAGRGPLHEATQDLAKVTLQVEQQEKSNESFLEKARAVCTRIATARAAEVGAALRLEVQHKGTRLESFFEDVSAGEEALSEEVFKRHVQALPGLSIPVEHLGILYEHLDQGAGVSRCSFLRSLQLHQACVKPIAVTTEFDIGKSKTLRMLEVSEVLEVLEGPRSDESISVPRIRGRVLADGLEGWVSVKGNQGTPFLKQTVKPYLVCSAAVALEKEFPNGSAELRSLAPGDVLEVLEGPRKEEFGEVMRAKCKTMSGVRGWFTVTDSDGVNAEVGKYYVCTTSIALTDMLEIQGCKVLRKLEVGEVLAVTKGPCEVEGALRFEGRTMKNETGWVTIRGNQGTVYCESSTKHYTVSRNVALQKDSLDSGTVGVLNEGETLEILEGPKEAKRDPVLRVRGRTIDGVEGWATMRGNLKPWVP